MVSHLMKQAALIGFIAGFMLGAVLMGMYDSPFYLVFSVFAAVIGAYTAKLFEDMPEERCLRPLGPTLYYN